MKYIVRTIEAAIIAVILTKLLHINRLADREWGFMIIVFLLWVIAPPVVAWCVNPNTKKNVSIKLYQWKREREIRRAVRQSKKHIKDVKNGKV